jgi:hypothetical protein
MNKFVVSQSYDLKLSNHSRIMLAFRYGIAIEEDEITGDFERYETGKTKQDNKKRELCIFRIGEKNQIALLVMAGLTVVTALPLFKNNARLRDLFDRKDASNIAEMFDMALAVMPFLYSMQEIVDWREKYIEGNGKRNKDTLRREAQNRSRPFFKEIKELRELAHKTIAADFDFDSPETHEEQIRVFDRLSNLAKTQLTLTDGEFDASEYIQSEEYLGWVAKNHEDSLRSNQESAREAIEEERFAHRETIRGVPAGGELVAQNGEKPIFFHKDCWVTGLDPSEYEDGFFHIYFRNQTQAFMLSTKWKQAFDSYEVGKTGIYTKLYETTGISYLEIYRES